MSYRAAGQGGGVPCCVGMVWRVCTPIFKIETYLHGCSRPPRSFDFPPWAGPDATRENQRDLEGEGAATRAVTGVMLCTDGLITDTDCMKGAHKGAASDRGVRRKEKEFNLFNSRGVHIYSFLFHHKPRLKDHTRDHTKRKGATAYTVTP